MFSRNQSGNTAMIFALCLLPIMIMVGVVVDMARIQAAESRVEAALDMALLAVARDANATNNTQTLVTLGQAAFTENMVTRGFEANCRPASISPDLQEKIVTGRADCDVPLTFASILGKPFATVQPHAKAAYGGTKVEIALMLDVSGSMSGQRLTDLQAAANELIDTLIPVSNTGDVRIALAPYSTAVNAGIYGDVTTGITDLYAHTVANLGADPDRLIDSYNVGDTSETFDLIDTVGNNGLSNLDASFYSCAADPAYNEIVNVCLAAFEPFPGDPLECNNWAPTPRQSITYPTHICDGTISGTQCVGDSLDNFDHAVDDYQCLDGAGSETSVAADWRNLDWTAASQNYADYDFSILGADHAANIGQLNCVTERGGTNAFTNASPMTHPVGAKASTCPGSAVEPLTHDKTILKTAIGNLNADGWTAGHLGIAWSWYTLSPEWSTVWPFNRRSELGGGYPVKRYAVLMTDGSFNTYYETGIGDSSAQAAAQCQAMKADGVEVYAVAFSAPSSAEVVLRDCATSSAHFFVASNGDELKDVYAIIAGDISGVRLTQ